MIESPNRDDILAQFNILMSEVLEGGTHRGLFQPWEIDILLDIESCKHRASTRTLAQYQRVVQAELEEGVYPPMRFSEYLERRATNRNHRNAPDGPDPRSTSV